MIDREKLLQALERCSTTGSCRECTYYGWYCLHNLFTDSLALLREQPQWISVDVALPEEHGDYLAIIDGQVKPVVFDYARRWARYTYKGIVVDDNVTHWMPLPKGVQNETN